MSEELDTNVGSDETKEVDLTTVAKATAETGAVLREDSAKVTDTNDGSGETIDVALTAVAKATAETEAVLK